MERECSKALFAVPGRNDCSARERCSSHFADIVEVVVPSGEFFGQGEVSRHEAGEARRPGMQTSDQIRRRIREFATALRDEFGSPEAGEHSCLPERAARRFRQCLIPEVDHLAHRQPAFCPRDHSDPETQPRDTFGSS